MTAAQDYLAALAGNLDAIETAEAPAIERAAELIAQSIIAGGVVHYMGSGHSMLVAIEPLQRAGGLAPVNVVLDPALSPARPRHAGRVERVTGYAEALLDLDDIRPGEVVVVISNSGINPVPVEFAAGASTRGARVVAITNRAHSRAAPSRHAQGLRLMDVADVVVDTHAPIGDAVVPVGELHAGAMSTVVGGAVINALTARVAQLLDDDDRQPPLIVSQNLQGGDAHNAAVLEPVRERVDRN